MGAASSAHKTRVGSPFSLFTKGLPQEKRKPFMELMKKLRTSKQATGTKEEKKKMLMAIDGEIHKLLEDDYKKYRLITEKLKAMRGSAKTTAVASPPPPPPPPPTTVMKKKKKKSASTA